MTSSFTSNFSIHVLTLIVGEVLQYVLVVCSAGILGFKCGSF